jgi:hypothetical protein
VVDDFGFAFGWGLNRMYLLGIPCKAMENYFTVPTSIHTLAGHRIVSVAAGSDHSIFLSDRGWPFVAGSAGLLKSFFVSFLKCFAALGKLGLFAKEAECSNFVSDCPIRLDVSNPLRAKVCF